MGVAEAAARVRGDAGAHEDGQAWQAAHCRSATEHLLHLGYAWPFEQACPASAWPLCQCLGPSIIRTPEFILHRTGVLAKAYCQTGP